MKRRLVQIAALGLLICLGNLAVAWALEIDAFTFFIPYPADALDDQFDAANVIDFSGSNIVTTISIAVLREGSVIYYDHWEDGLEANITQPNQPTTEIWGDNNPANGIPPDFSIDVLDAGDVITLQNVIEVDPRDPAVVLFDGGDKLVSMGGAVAVNLAVWPETVLGEDLTPIPGILFAGAWELYPTSRWGVEHVIPVGQNVLRGAGSFRTVGLNVQAVQDDTLVRVDLDANGEFDITRRLNEGEQLTEVEGVNAGARVSASAPVQVHLFTGNPPSIYEARAYTMLPRGQWTGDYLAPRSSDGDYWLYNPHQAELVISAETITGTTVLTVPANSATNFPIGGLSTATGVHFTAADDFYGIAALDEADAQDWGYALLPIENLTTQALIGWAPGNNNTPPDGDQSRVYVTAVSTTTVVVDYDNDGAPDARYFVAPLAEVDITDPTDHNMTGAWLYVENGVPFIAVWGQDEDAPPALPSIDVGTNIVPLPAPSIQQHANILSEGYMCGELVQPYTLGFELHAYNDSFNDISDVIVADDLPPEFRYMRGSAAMTTTVDSTVVESRPISDDGSGSPFPLDEGGYNVGTIPGFGETLITFMAQTTRTGVFINRAEIISPPADPSIKTLVLPVRVTGYAMSKTLIDPPGGLVDPEPGQVITFSLSITNTGAVTITRLPVWDQFDERVLTFRSASVPPDLTAAGVITWTDLTVPFGDLPPDASIGGLLSFAVDYPLPPGVARTNNVVLGEGVQDSLERTQAITCGVASLSLPSPTPTVPVQTPAVTPPVNYPDTPEPPTETPTPPVQTPTPGTGTPTPGTGTPTLGMGTPTPGTGTPGFPGGGTPTLSVLLLPETGSPPGRGLVWWSWIALPLLGLLAAWAVRMRKG
jgi:uncharacterized repeat protein (TIGR01451 family)